MSRYIDADALIDDIKRNSESYFAEDFASIWVNEQPTIDLVRCGECKYWIGDCTNEIWQSPTDDYLPQTNADDFCSYGEREGE